jgi:hypothetical protein
MDLPAGPRLRCQSGQGARLVRAGGRRRPAGPDEYVISADEKSQLQALARRHPELAGAPGRTRRVEFEYTRGGTLCYLGAYDVHAARLFGRVAEKSGIVPFMELVNQVMSTEPYASARRVWWIVDNGSSHNGRSIGWPPPGRTRASCTCPCMRPG